jgi:hypothetical protein
MGLNVGCIKTSTAIIAPGHKPPSLPPHLSGCWLQRQPHLHALRSSLPELGTACSRSERDCEDGTVKPSITGPSLITE